MISVKPNEIISYMVVKCFPKSQIHQTTWLQKEVLEEALKTRRGHGRALFTDGSPAPPLPRAKWSALLASFWVSAHCYRNSAHMDSDQPTWGEAGEAMGDTGTHAVVWADDKDMVWPVWVGKVEETCIQPLEESGHQHGAARGPRGLGWGRKPVKCHSWRNL